jgi:hypothetical protein
MRDSATGILAGMESRTGEAEEKLTVDLTAFHRGDAEARSNNTWPPE